MRLECEGRLVVERVSYEGGWVSAGLGRCFQLMECEDMALLQQWVANWENLVELEVVPVASGDETADAVTTGTE